MSLLKRLKLKSHKTLSALAALVLPLVIYELAFPVPVFRFIIPAFVILVGLVQSLSWSTLAHLREARAWSIVRSNLFYLGWLLLFFLMPSQDLAALYMVASVPVLFLAQYFIGFTGETVLVTHTILTGFALLLGAAASEYYFHAGSAYLTLVVFVALFLLSRATFVFAPQSSSVRLAASVFVALLAAESFAALLLLPFHYTVLGLLSFLAFYLLWIFTYYWQFGVLTQQKVKFYLFIALSLAVVLLLVTPWQIMS